MPRTKKTDAEDAVLRAPETAVSDSTEAKTRKPRTKKAESEASDAPKAAHPKKAKVSTKVVIELQNSSSTTDDLITRAKSDWEAKGNSADEIKELALYVNASESMVYYVVNDDSLSGSFAF